jgi:hypothetical protein
MISSEKKTGEHQSWSAAADTGPLKTKIAEEWAEARKFRVRRIDRRLDKHLRRTDQEPLLALAGLDRMPPRRLLGVARI